MAALILPHLWNRQPQGPVTLDRNWSDGAVSVWHYENQGRDPVDEKIWTREWSTTEFALGSRAIVGNGSTGLAWRAIPSVTAGFVTLLVLSKSTTSTQTGVFAGIGNSGVASNGYFGVFGRSSGTVIGVQATDLDSVYYNTNSTDLHNSSARSGFASVVHADLDTATGSEWWVNGTLETALTHLGGKTAGYAYDRFSINGLRRSASGAWVIGRGALAALWVGRRFSSEELKSLSLNPWQIFKPLPRRIYVDLGAGGGSQTLTPDLFSNTNTFYTPTVTSSKTLTPALFTNTNTFFNATVTQAGGAQTLTPNLFSNTNSFFSPTVNRGTVTLAPNLFTNTNTFFSPTITEGGATQELFPSLLSNTNTFHSSTVTVGAVTLIPNLFTNTNTFFSPSVVNGTVTLSDADLLAIANAVWAHPQALTLGKFLALKDL